MSIYSKKFINIPYKEIIKNISDFKMDFQYLCLERINSYLKYLSIKYNEGSSSIRGWNVYQSLKGIEIQKILKILNIEYEHFFNNNMSLNEMYNKYEKKLKISSLILEKKSIRRIKRILAIKR